MGIHSSSVSSHANFEFPREKKKKLRTAAEEHNSVSRLGSNFWQKVEEGEEKEGFSRLPEI